jgi:hypothetical protein
LWIFLYQQAFLRKSNIFLAVGLWIDGCWVDGTKFWLKGLIRVVLNNTKNALNKKLIGQNFRTPSI